MKEGLVDHGQLVLEGTPTEIKKKNVCKTNFNERCKCKTRYFKKETDFHYENQLVMVSRVSH